MNLTLYIIIDFLLALLLGTVIIPRILVISKKRRLYDLPSTRKVHDDPIPRLGGVSFVPIMLITVGFTAGLISMINPGGSFPGADANIMRTRFLFLLASSSILYLVGECDDLIGLGYKVKFAAQFLAAFLLVISGCWIRSFNGFFGIHELTPWLGMIFSGVLIIFITNAINLIDGVDGLASGLCILALLVYLAVFYLEGMILHAVLAASALGALVPFWVFNVFGNAKKGQKIFMGDTGSLTMGLVLSFLAISICNIEEPYELLENKYILVAFSALLVPALDVIRVYFYRIRHKRNPFLPDKNHIHHKLIRTGLRFRYVTLSIIGLSFALILLTVVLQKHLNITWVIIIDILVFTIIQLALDALIVKREIRKHLAHDNLGNEFKVDNPDDAGKLMPTPEEILQRMRRDEEKEEGGIK